MFKKILIATDGSETSKQAAEKAIALARSGGAEALAVSVIDLRNMVGPYMPGAQAFYYPTLVDDLRAAAQGFADDVVAQGAKLGITVKADVTQGVPAASIIEAAKKWGADLIVMGTHGRTGLKLLLVGSTAQAVVHGSAVPVLLVR